MATTLMIASSLRREEAKIALMKPGAETSKHAEQAAIRDAAIRRLQRAVAVVVVNLMSTIVVIATSTFVKYPQYMDKYDFGRSLSKSDYNFETTYKSLVNLTLTIAKILLISITVFVTASAILQSALLFILASFGIALETIYFLLCTVLAAIFLFLGSIEPRFVQDALLTAGSFTLLLLAIWSYYMTSDLHYKVIDDTQAKIEKQSQWREHRLKAVRLGVAELVNSSVHHNIGIGESTSVVSPKQVTFIIDETNVTTHDGQVDDETREDETRI